MEEQIKRNLWNKNFLLMWQGSAVSTFGDVLYSISIGIWVFQETGSTMLMGVMSSISMFVSMVGMPIAGAIIDRSNRRNVVVLTDFIRGVLMLFIGILALNNHLNVIWVLITAFIAAGCNLFFSPSVISLIVDLVEKEDVIRAQSLQSGTGSLISLIGKGLSGAMIAFLGIPVMILINGVSFLFSAFTEMFIKVEKQEKQGTRISIKNVVDDLKGGINYLAKNVYFRKLILGALLANLFASGFSAMLYPFAIEKGFNLNEYGIFMAFSSLAGLIGMATVGVIKIPPKHRHLVMGVSFLFSTIFTVLALLSKSFIGVSSITFLADFFNIIANSILSAFMITSMPAQSRGMILGLFMAGSSGGIALSSIAFGFLAQFFSVSIIGIVGTILSLLPLIIIVSDQHLKRMLCGEEEMPIIE